MGKEILILNNVANDGAASAIMLDQVVTEFNES
jgi:hypothetical protein